MEHPIYYVSRVLHDAETRYQNIEKFAFAVVVVAKKLCPYTSSPHDSCLYRPTITKLDTLGRLINWAVELGEFDIQVRTGPVIKTQVFADFIIECTAPTKDSGGQEEPPAKQHDKQYPWMLFVNGSANSGGSGVGLVLAGPDKFLVEYALKLDFNALNNEAEYEAFLAGLSLALELEANRLKAHNDS
ncbi:uncharacterized protein LOC143858840 [Tasmannia lanceolata]|uniref:uncharacterized protein LOC143858840 n=1 Tax=Tasmannia lanceolata TaxID=3420 RepID=UPI004063B6D1